MSSRVAGAGLALIAAALFAVSIATPVALPANLSLFAGHPTVKDRTREAQDVYVGLYDAQLCNSGGDGTCKSDITQEKSAFRFTGYGELGATGLLVVSLVVLAFLTVRNSERRNGAARLVRIAGAVALGGAVALIVEGPFPAASAPIGLGMWLHGAAIFGAGLASVIAVRSPPPIKLRVADRGSQPVAAIPAAVPPFDMQAVFGEDQLRPRERGPEPKPWRDARARPELPPSADELDEAHDAFETPFPQPSGDQPLFSSAPQLRPLYDATPLQGGTGGLLPIERPMMPTRPPTPVSRAAISAAGGIPAQLPFPGERPKTLPPPNFGARGKPASIPPPIPAGAAPRTQVSLVPPMPDNSVVIAPPPPQLAPAPQLAPPPLAPPGDSDGSPEAAESPPNTEPNLFLGEAAPDPAPIPDAPVPRPRAETPLAPPPPPIGPAPRPQRESQLPRPQRDTQSPRPGLRAAVPMPARPARAPGPTRPPPLSISNPVRGAPPRPAIAVPSNIPPIPAIPAIPMLTNRAETDPHERAETLSEWVDSGPPSEDRNHPSGGVSLAGIAGQDVDQATGSQLPIEIGDSTSQTNVSFGMVTAEELDAAVDEVGAPRNTPGDVLGGADLDDAIETGGHERATAPELGFADTTAAGPLEDRSRAPSSTEPNNVMAPPPAAALPLPVVIAAPPLVRDRPIPKLPISTAPDSLPPPKDNKQQSGPSPACPQCESPMAWVEEHLRFYCKSCRMYF